MFRHRIKDLMIVNAALAVVLGAAIALGSFTAVVSIGTVTVTLVVLPVLWVESYLYRKKNGIWYRWRHPIKPRPRHVAPIDPATYRRLIPFHGAGEPVPAEPPPRPRTRLFESGDLSEPVSRVSLLLKVASRLETSGRIGAAMRVYQQVIDNHAETPEAQTAAHRLQTLVARHGRVGIPEADG
jgi:hypothetical protein